jgi:hypothetical protein
LAVVSAKSFVDLILQAKEILKKQWKWPDDLEKLIPTRKEFVKKVALLADFIVDYEKNNR